MRLRTFQRPHQLLLAGGVLALGVLGLVAALFQPGRSSPQKPDLVMQATEMASARVAIERGQLEVARRHLDALLAVSPRHSQALLYRGQIRRESGDLAGALEDWRQVSAEDQRDAGIAAYLESTVLLEQGDAISAEERLRRSMELHPGYVQPQRRFLELLVVQARRDEIRDHLQMIRQLRNWSIEEQVFNLVPPQRATTPDSGAALMQQYVATRPEDVHSRWALALYLLMAGKLGEAEQELATLLLHNPDSGTAAALLAQVYLKQGAIEKAEQLLDRHPLTSAASAWLLRSHAQYHERQGNWADAATLYDRVLLKEPEDLASLYQSGRVLQRLGRVDEAQVRLRDAERVDRLQTESLRLVWGSREKIESMVSIANGVGELLLELDRPDEAGEWFRQVLVVAPRSPRALDGLLEADALSEASANATPGTAAEFSVVDVPSETTPRRHADAASEKESFASAKFRDVHREVRLTHQYFNGQTEFKYLVESTGGGVAALDYDRDGWPDLYFPQGCAIPVDESDHSHLDSLWRNQGGIRFEDVTEDGRIAEARYGQGLAAGDLDNDGFPDLIIANYGRNTVFRNNGDGTFTEVTERSGLEGTVMSSSVALADLDRDGRLDVYVANYVDSMKVCQNSDGTYSTCNPANFEGEQDRLYLNSGDFTFLDITSESGITARGGKGLGVVIADLNRDRWPDIYVANDTTPNFLFRHNGSAEPLKFTELGLEAGVALSGEGRAQAGMGIACGDLDGNGFQDLFVTNFFQETNTLYLNEAGELFYDATQSANLAVPSHPQLGFGTQAIDFNRDGLLDLIVANGHIDDFRNRGEPWKMPPQVFENYGAARFSEASRTAGDYFTGEYLGRGLARFDWNRDGLMDVIIVHQDRPVALLQNETERPGHFISLELYGVESNRDAVGAVITSTCGEAVQVHEIVGGDGYFATNERRQIIGIGGAGQVDRLDIDWPSGRRDTWQAVPAGSHLILVEGSLPMKVGP